MIFSGRIIIFLFCLITPYSFSQNLETGIKAVQMRPTGFLGFMMNKSVSAELLIVWNPANDKFRFRGGAGYFSLNPRADTLPLTSFSYDNLVHPGYIVYHKYDIFLFTLGADVLISKWDPLIFYFGNDVITGDVSEKYFRDIAGVETVDYEGSSVIGGARFRIGIEYNFNEKFMIFWEGTRSYFALDGDDIFSGHEKFLSYNDLGLGVKIILE